MIKLTRKVHFTRRPNRSRAMIVDIVQPAAHLAPGRLPHVSRLMALAIRFDRMIREGKVADLSELARLAHVTQPRMTQIMNLNHLAPDIHEELLFLPRVTRGRELVYEKTLRPVCAESDWEKQWKLRQMHPTSAEVCRVPLDLPVKSREVSPGTRPTERIRHWLQS